MFIMRDVLGANLDPVSSERDGYGPGLQADGTSQEIGSFEKESPAVPRIW
jgi:hypothetical protein